MFKPQTSKKSCEFSSFMPIIYAKTKNPEFESIFEMVSASASGRQVLLFVETGVKTLVRLSS
jgi:hypothetical protein